MINRLCTLAEFTNGKFVNGSLRSSSCTRMFDGNQSKQVIQSVNGHRSTCVKLRRQTSQAIQGPALCSNKNESLVVYSLQLLKIPILKMTLSLLKLRLRHLIKVKMWQRKVHFSLTSVK